MFPIMAAAGIASGLLGGVVGLGQKRKAKNLLNSLQRPTYNVPQEILKSQKMAELSAQEGLPSQQYNRAMQNIRRQQNAAIQAATDRRSGLMAITGSQRAANDASLNLDVADAHARQANQRTLYGVSNQTAGYRDKAFQINQLQPYEQQRQYAESLLGAGNQNIMSGIDKVLGGGLGLLGGGEGAGGILGGRKRRMTAGAINQPSYYNGYDQNSDYSGFETGY